MSNPQSALERFRSHVGIAPAAPRKPPHVLLGPRRVTNASQLKRNDPWLAVLRNLDITPDDDNIIKATNPDGGESEWRIKSYYLLVTVLGLAPKRVRHVDTLRLAICMRKAGWTRPQNLRFRGKQAKGFFKPVENAAGTANFAQSA
jgi:hypothetical protein